MGLLEKLSTIVPANRELAIICAGTDRSTGDSYGPLVGTKLKALFPTIPIYGTLHEPVHAINISTTHERVRNEHVGCFVLAIDAALGSLDYVGTIEAVDEPLRPGAGVKRNLPVVGDASIQAVVNVKGFQEYFVLQNTRLSFVMDLVDQTVDALSTFITSRRQLEEVAVPGGV